LKIRNFFGITLRPTSLAIRPANCDHELAAVFKIAEVTDSFLKSIWCFHAIKITREAWSVNYILAQTSPSRSAVSNTICSVIGNSSVEEQHSETSYRSADKIVACIWATLHRKI